MNLLSRFDDGFLSPPATVRTAGPNAAAMQKME
jgi:hypothetical protein